MLFSSITFLYYFLPCVLILYFAVPGKWRNGVLLAGSLFFYGWGEPRYLIVMAVSIVQGYVLGRLIEKYRERKRTARVFLAVSAVFSLGILGVFKYADFFLENLGRLTGLSIPLLKLTLPIGISFYTFQMLSYVIDVYRQTVPAQKSLIDLAAYIAMFPQLIAGPIVRYSDLREELKERRHSLDGAAEGIRRFAVGLSKKILLANTLGELVQIYKDTGEKSVVFVWMYVLAFTLQIYFDFSGYSDMAIGLGKIFGFHFPENFRYPYIAAGIRDFWRRWHISLSTWFRDYLYIPLGGNRVSRGRWIFNILVVWMATGLWHGAAWNFVVWGLFWGLLLILERFWLGKFLENRKWLGHLYVPAAVLLSFVVFDAASLGEAFRTMGSLLGLGGLPAADPVSLYYLRSYGPVLLLAAVGTTPLPAMAVEKLSASAAGGFVERAVKPVAAVLLLLVCTAFLVDGSFNPFLYFRF